MLLRKHFVHKGRNEANDIKASSREACDAGRRIFSKVSLLFRTRKEVLAILGPPETISDYNQRAKEASAKLEYTFDNGFGGYKYTIHFGELDKERVSGVEVVGLD